MWTRATVPIIVAIIVFAVRLLFLAGSADAQQVPLPADAPADSAVGADSAAPVPYQRDRLLIRFAPDADEAAQRAALARIGGHIIQRIPGIDVAVVSVADTASAQDALTDNSAIEVAEPDYEVHILDMPQPPVERISRAYVPVAFSADDPRLHDQWHHAVIHTAEAWRFSRGAGITIAIVDTGVACGLADLLGQCVAGYDFVNDDDDPADDHGHGTDVASIAAASAHNGIDGAGVAPDARLMPLKAMSAAGTGSHASIAAAIVWATDHGADIINLSLGGYFTSNTLRDAVAYAADHGVTLVAAAGNDSAGTPTFPAAYSDVIAVTATTRDDSYWRPSNYGDFVDVAAPGADVATTTLDGFGSASGTSEATPIVSAIAALLLSQDRHRTSADVLDRIAHSAVDLGEPGWDPFFGYGRVDAGAALASEPPSPDAPNGCGESWQLVVHAFPDTDGFAGYHCNGCDGSYGNTDAQQASSCPLPPLMLQVVDPEDPAHVLWSKAVTRRDHRSLDIVSVISLCVPPPYEVRLLTTATPCYTLCPNSAASQVVTQRDFDHAYNARPGSGRRTTVDWFFWQCSR